MTQSTGSALGRNDRPKVELVDRKRMEERTQTRFYAIANQYECIGARRNWRCDNPDCQVIINTYNYYYKHKGSKAWWNFRRYQCWDRVCQDCYYDHVLSPTTSEWRRRMEGRLTSELGRIEKAMAKIDVDKHAVRVRYKKLTPQKVGCPCDSCQSIARHGTPHSIMKYMKETEGVHYCKSNKDKPLVITNLVTGKQTNVRSFSRKFYDEQGNPVIISCKFMNTKTKPNAKRSGAKAMLIIKRMETNGTIQNDHNWKRK